MTYLETIVVEVEKNLILADETENELPSRECATGCSLYDVFKDCNELKKKEYLNLTEIKNHLDPNLTEKGQEDYWVQFFVSSLFIPYTKKMYITAELRFNNYELVKELFDDNLLSDKKYAKYICDYAVKAFENRDIKLKDNIVFTDKINIVTLITGWQEKVIKSMFPLYMIAENSPSPFVPYVVAKLDILNTLRNDILCGCNKLKRNERFDHNQLLLSIKKRYIDYLNVDSDVGNSIRGDGTKNVAYNELLDLMNISFINEQFQKELNIYKDLVETIVSRKNTILADTLNTIQIASIVLTVVGWALVILQHDLPSRTTIYLFAILLCSIVSISAAVFIKKVIDKKS